MRFDLPDPELSDLSAWPRRRREWMSTAEDCLYGHAPEGHARGRVMDRYPVWGGKGFREEVCIFMKPDHSISFPATLYVPKGPGPHPVITWNQFSQHDWDKCPYEEAVAKYGFIVAGFERETVWADSADGPKPVRSAFPGWDWGGVRAWAFAQSCLLDYLLSREDVDPNRLVCTGFSRGGKAALACGIFDERYQICAPICSGAGGCGCFRYLGDEEGFCQDVTKVESLGRVGSVFPYWWGPGFPRWFPEGDPAQMGKEREFPLDAHILKALIAPRTLFSLEGIGDAWSNPRGTALTWRAAQPVFDRVGGLNIAHFRPGGHDFSADDWRTLLRFCDDVFAHRDVSAYNNCPFPEET